MICNNISQFNYYNCESFAPKCIKEVMRKFYVLFCQKNLHKPKIYKTLPLVVNQVKNHKTLQYAAFESEAQAQTFMHPKSLAFINQSEYYLQKGVNLKKFYKDKKKIDPNVQFQFQQKKSMHRLLDEMQQEISALRTPPIPKGKKKSKEVQKQLLSSSKSTIWLIAAFENRDKWKVQDLPQDLQQCLQKLQSNGLISKKIYISEDIQKEETLNSQVKIFKKPKGKKNEKYLDLQKFEFKDQPQLNIKIKDIFENMIIMQDKDQQNLITTSPDYPVTEDDQCILMISAQKQAKTKNCGIAYFLNKTDGTFILKNQYTCNKQSLQQCWFYALLFGLCQCFGNKIAKVKILCDEEIIVKSMQSKLNIKDQNLTSKYFLAKVIISKLSKVGFQLVSSQMNYQARDMAIMAAKNKIK